MLNQKQRAEQRIIDNENDYEDMDDIIAKHFDPDDSLVDNADDVLHEINTNVEYRHLRSFSLKEIEANVIAYAEVTKEAKAVWHRPN